MATREAERKSSKPTFTQEEGGSGAAGSTQPVVPTPTTQASTTEVGLSPFLTVLVTPKLTFSLPRQPDWKVPEDIGQDELRAAFLSRFPVRFEVGALNFRCATPAVDLRAQDRLVFRVTAAGAEEDRVLPSILRELDKAYTARFEGQLEQARADMLSSSMTFQVVADEIREGQAAYQKKWEKETRSMKEHLSINQKRLFLLEQEKNQLQQTASTSESLTGVLRDRVAGLSEENAALKERMAQLEAQLQTMSTVLSQQLEVSGAGAGGALASALACSSSSDAAAAPQASVASQTEVDETARVWQQQLIAVSDWPQTGAALLQPVAALQGGGVPDPNVPPEG